jgi:ATP-dependent Clp protease ATP-binding subunit ClpB
MLRHCLVTSDVPLAKPKHVQSRLAKLDLILEVSDAALDLLCEEGFDPVYGARPLKRAIQQSIENPLSKELLSGKFLPGATIRADGRGAEIVLA